MKHFQLVDSSISNFARLLCRFFDDSKPRTVISTMTPQDVINLRDECSRYISGTGNVAHGVVFTEAEFRAAYRWSRNTDFTDDAYDLQLCQAIDLLYEYRTHLRGELNRKETANGSE